jgi:hypothetical protein
MIQIYEYSNPDKHLDTHYGTITYHDYLLKEKERLTTAKRQFEIRYKQFTHENRISLWGTPAEGLLNESINYKKTT